MVGSNGKTLLAAVFAVLVAVGVTTAASAGAAPWTGDLNDFDASTQAATLSLAVDQDHATGTVTVTVTSNGSAVANATVIVEGDAYAGNGTYATDANGTVTLPEPNATVTVDITAAKGGASTTTTVTLEPRAESLAVSVVQHDDGTATVTVTQYGDPVDNATVVVEGDAYAGNGSYVTDANGTVALPAPADTVTVNVSAAHGNLSAETTATLFPDALGVEVVQHADGTATVTVTENGSAVPNATVRVAGDAYAGNGTYTTDANGTVSLPAPDEDVTVTVTAAKGDESGSTTVTLDGTGELAVSVTQHADRTATVLVTRNGTAVENATVTVSGDAYAGNGTYATDANGTVTLPAPDQDVTVTVRAMDGNDAASVTVTLDGPAQQGDLAIGVHQGAGYVVIAVTDGGQRIAGATVTIDGLPAIAGTYSTGGNGFVVLDAPTSGGQVTISASAGNRSAERTVAIRGFNGRGPPHVPFGKYVEAFVDALLHDVLEKPLGHYVSEFTSSHGGDGGGQQRGNQSAGQQGGPDEGHGNGQAKGHDKGTNKGNGRGN